MRQGASPQSLGLGQVETQALGPDCKIGDLELDFHPGPVLGSVLFHGERRPQAQSLPPPLDKFSQHFMLSLGPHCIDLIGC